MAAGATGLAAIRKRGGLTVAQDPATAAMDKVLPSDAIGPFFAAQT